MTITDSQAEALALVLSMMRPDWNPQGVLTLIKKHRDDHEFPALARASVNAATNPNVRTPAVIFMPGSHWADPSAKPKTTPHNPLWDGPREVNA